MTDDDMFWISMVAYAFVIGFIIWLKTDPKIRREDGR
jgi:hypothetical protein